MITCGVMVAPLSSFLFLYFCSKVALALALGYGCIHAWIIAFFIMSTSDYLFVFFFQSVRVCFLSCSVFCRVWLVK
jgi:hypothetical protein